MEVASGSDSGSDFYYPESMRESNRDEGESIRASLDKFEQRCDR